MPDSFYSTSRRFSDVILFFIDELLIEKILVVIVPTLHYFAIMTLYDTIHDFIIGTHQFFFVN